MAVFLPNGSNPPSPPGNGSGGGNGPGSNSGNNSPSFGRARITGFSPQTVKFADTLRIRGVGLANADSVYIGGVAARITHNTDTEIWCYVPHLRTEANRVEVEVDGQTILAPSSLRYQQGRGTGTGLMGAVGAAASASVGLGASTYSSVKNVAGSVAGAGGQLLGAGASIGGAALGAALAPFGATGAGLSNIGGAALMAAANAVGGGVQLAGSALGAGVGIVAGAASLPLHLAGGLVGGAGSLAGGVGGAALGGLSSIIGMAAAGVGKIFSVISAGAQSVVKIAGDAFGHLGTLAGTIFSSSVSIIGDVLSEVRTLGQSVRSLSWNGGISEAAAGRAVNAFSFAGIGPQQVSSAFSSPQAALSIGMRARILGLPDPTQDPEGFLTGGSRLYQQAGRGGMMGSMMFSAMAGPQLMGMAGNAWSMGPERLERNMALAKSFALPGTIGNDSRDLDAISAAATALAGNLKATLGAVLVELMPAINRGLSWIIEHKSDIVGAVQSVGHALVSDLPPFLLRTGATILRVTATVFEEVGGFLTGTFQQWGVSLLQALPGILQGTQTFLTGMASLGAGIVGVAAAIAQAAYNFQQTQVGQWITGGGANATGNTGATGGGNPTPGSTSNTQSNAVPPYLQPFAPVGPSGNQTITPSAPPTTTNTTSSNGVTPAWLQPVFPTAPGSNGGLPPRTSHYSQTVPYSGNSQPPFGGPTTTAFGGSRARNAAILAGAAGGAYGGAKVGGVVGSTVLGVVGAIGGGILGAGAGGVGLIPGVVGGWGAGASAGAAPGAVIGGVIGAAGGAWGAYQAMRHAQNTAQGTFNPQAAQQAGILPPGASTVMPTTGPQAGPGGGSLAPLNPATIKAAMQNGGQVGPTNPLLPQQNRTPGQAFAAGQGWAQSLMPSFNVTGQQSNIADAIKAVLGAGDTVGGWMKDKAPGLRDTADDLDRKADGWREMMRSNERIARAVEGLERQNNRMPNMLANLMSQTVPRTAAYIAEDYAAASLRV